MLEGIIVTRMVKSGVLFTASLGILLMSCGDVSGPSEYDGYDGWVVGNTVGGYAMILHTTNSGNTWTRQGSTESIPNVGLGCVQAVDSLHAWACGPASDGYATIIRTSDAGETWERMGSAADIPNVELQSISILGASNVWISGSGNTILHTADGGVTWTDMSDPAFDGHWFEGIFALDANNIWACGGNDAGNNGILIHSGDGGITWSAQGDSILLTGYPLLSVTAWDPDHAWLVGHGYTFARTTDGGANWELCPPDSLIRGAPFDTNGIMAFSQTDVWACQDLGVVYITTNGGDSWVKQDVPSGSSGYLLLRISSINLNNAWTVGIGVDGGIILGQVDGGNWVVQPSPSSEGLFDVSFAGANH